MLTRRPCARRRVTLTRRDRLRPLTARELLGPGWTRWPAVGPSTSMRWITVVVFAAAGGCVLSITRVAAPVIDALSATLMFGLFAAFDAMFSVAVRSPTALLPTKATVTRHELPGATGAEQPLAVNSLLVVDTLSTLNGTWPVLRSATPRVTLASSARRGGNESDVVLSDEKADGAGVGPAILPSTVNRSLNSPPVTSPVTGSV